MSNSGLIARMQHVLDEYEAGRLTSEAVEKSIEFHMQGLEQIGRSAVGTARDLSHRLVVSHMSDGEQEFIDAEKISTVIAEFRQFLKSLPGAGP
jgi:hypothetical protein